VINWKKYYKNIPSSIKIGKSIYEIVWLNDFHKDEHQLGESRFGPLKQIVINLNQPIKEAVHTYFHELIHVLSYEYDANLTENQVRSLERGLKDIIRPGNIWKKEVSNATKQTKRRNVKKTKRTK
jgi:hypothetical protein